MQTEIVAPLVRDKSHFVGSCTQVFYPSCNQDWVTYFHCVPENPFTAGMPNLLLLKATMRRVRDVWT
jgi:hypothetical protein